MEIRTKMSIAHNIQQIAGVIIVHDAEMKILVLLEGEANGTELGVLKPRLNKHMFGDLGKPFRCLLLFV